MDILVVEKQALLRDALRTLLVAQWPGTRVAGFGAGVEVPPFLHQVRHLDLALLDGDGPWEDCLETLVRRLPATPALVLSHEVSLGQARRAKSLGARGYAAKTLPGSALLQVVQFVLAGGEYVTPAVVDGPDSLPDLSQLFRRLTPRQREILPMLAEGLTNKAIAGRLGLTEGAVKVHVQRLTHALGVRNRAAAAALGIHLGGREAAPGGGAD